ncbi:MAG: amidohydrolase [Phycisphaerae bacterium]|nr:amidohydrolase [Phycisphaerae bacterium]
MHAQSAISRRDLLKGGVATSVGFAAGWPAFAANQNGAGSAPAIDLILHNARLSTLDPKTPNATAFAVAGDRFVAVGDEREIMPLRGPNTRVVDAGGRRVIPGLNDSHLHVIREGLNYNMELRWDGVSSLADALEMVRQQARITPPPQWVRVVGGWNEYQFKERRLPTLDELNAAAPDTPVFILHLYDRALLNRAALRAVGYAKDTPAPPGAFIERDSNGEPTGLLVAKPNAYILYKTLSLGPRLSPEDQLNSSRHYMRELNRLGVTSVIDAGGGFQNYPEDYAIIQELHRRGEMSVRIAYNLFAQKAGSELADFKRWMTMVKPGQGDDMLRHNGAGENLVMSAADFEDFLEPRPDLADKLETELADVVTLLAQNRWPFRLHATYDESISRFLTIFERVNRDVPFNGLRWFFDHAETVSDRNLDRIRALGGGIAIQHRMAYQGEYFVDRYGADAAKHTPPLRKMLNLGIPVGGGTDGTRVASYNPWVAFSWMISGQTVGGLSLYDESNLLSREEALRTLTVGSAWFSGEQAAKGSIKPGQFADFAVMSKDCMTIPAAETRAITSLLTVMGGRLVHAADDAFRELAPPPLPVSPDWSPVKRYGGYQSSAIAPRDAKDRVALAGCGCARSSGGVERRLGPGGIWGSAGCDCFAF